MDQKTGIGSLYDEFFGATGRKPGCFVPISARTRRILEVRSHEQPRVGERATVMSFEPCPRCGKLAIVTGRIPTLRGDPEFVPEGVRWLENLRRRLFQGNVVVNPVVKLLGPAWACLDC